jgi:hypothetical protein
MSFEVEVMKCGHEGTENTAQIQPQVVQLGMWFRLYSVRGRWWRGVLQPPLVQNAHRRALGPDGNGHAYRLAPVVTFFDTNTDYFEVRCSACSLY